MHFIKFTMQHNEEFGDYGIVPNRHRNWPNYLPSSPFGIAHDIMEHGTRETGTFDEELAAHGGYLYVRCFGTVHSSTVSAEARLAGGMARQLEESTISEIRTAPKAYGLTKDEITDIETFGRVYCDALRKDWDNENYEEQPTEENPFYGLDDKIINWLKYGYARAKRRWKDQGLAFALFESIERNLKSVWSTLNLYGETGHEFTLVLDVENGVASVRHPWAL